MEDRRGVGEAVAALKEVGIHFREAHPLALHTTMGIGGEAPLFVEPCSVEEAFKVLGILKNTSLLGSLSRDASRDNGIPPWFSSLLVLGKGSNLLLCESGFSRVVLSTGGLSWVKVEGEGRIRVGAGTPLPKLLAFCIERGISGLEPLSGIPGTVGGMVAMNAGSFGRTMGELVEEVLFLTPEGELVELKGDQVEWGYRESSLKGRGVVLEVLLRLQKGDTHRMREEVEGFKERRRRSQPLEYPSAGSVFKNPPGHSAGALIEKVGLKGERCGGAAISEKHANFIVNLGGARCSDVLRLVETAKRRVFEEFGVILQEEMEYVC